MTAQPPVTVEGDERLAATAHKAADDLANMDSANRAIGEVVRNRAAGDAPKVTGRLAGSVYVASTSGVEVVIAAREVYAPAINYGWPARNIAPQPFMTNALTESQSRAVEIYEARCNAIVGNIKGA